MPASRLVTLFICNYYETRYAVDSAWISSITETPDNVVPKWTISEPDNIVWSATTLARAIAPKMLRKYHHRSGIPLVFLLS